VDETSWPFAYELPELNGSAYVPAEGFATGRTTSAYVVPAVTVAGVAKVPVK